MFWANRSYPEGAFAHIESHLGESRRVEARKDGTGTHRRECAADVTDAVKPTVRNLEGNENAAGAQDAKGFGEHLILKLSRFEVVENEDGQDGREGLTGKGQIRRVAADSESSGTTVLRFQFNT